MLSIRVRRTTAAMTKSATLRSTYWVITSEKLHYVPPRVCPCTETVGWRAVVCALSALCTLCTRASGRRSASFPAMAPSSISGWADKHPYKYRPHRAYRVWILGLIALRLDLSSGTRSSPPSPSGVPAVRLYGYAPSVSLTCCCRSSAHHDQGQYIQRIAYRVPRGAKYHWGCPEHKTTSMAPGKLPTQAATEYVSAK